MLIVFGFLGYVCKKIDFPVAPMAFTLILGPLTEKALRQALSMSGGGLAILHAEPISPPDCCAASAPGAAVAAAPVRPERRRAPGQSASMISRPSTATTRSARST